MIKARTGLPGSGKTLSVLADVQADQIKTARPVYYSGIKDLRLPGWIELTDDEVRDWLADAGGIPRQSEVHADSTGRAVVDELAPAVIAERRVKVANAVLVVDEAQRILRPRAPGARVPQHVAALETHRHSGCDIYLITQHPMLLDGNVRRLIGEHGHVVRAFGTKAAVIHTWNEVNDAPDKVRGDSMQRAFRYPTELFHAYHSAEVHTHKARIPLRLWLLVGAPIGICVLGFFAYRSLMATGHVAGAKEATGAVAGGGKIHPEGGAAHTLTTAEYVEQFKPRIPDLPHSAPAYDGVMKIATAPYPAGAAVMGGRCVAYTDQGTRLAVSPRFCHQLIDEGIFDIRGNPFAKKDQDRRGRETTTQRDVATGLAGTPGADSQTVAQRVSVSRETKIVSATQ